jgi:hypothetical protein
MKPFRFLLGLMTGAAIVSYPAALILLYGVTGKLLVISKGKQKLMDLDEATGEVRTLLYRARERFHG